MQPQLLLLVLPVTKSGTKLTTTPHHRSTSTMPAAHLPTDVPTAEMAADYTEERHCNEKNIRRPSNAIRLDVCDDDSHHRRGHLSIIRIRLFSLQHTPLLSDCCIIAFRSKVVDPIICFDTNTSSS